jgi:2-amino-4-hydroxy-6-hydroxymethyldihydropteridine diphosphokinase
MVDCYIAIGSNLGDRLATANAAVSAMGKLADSHLLRQSSWYQSKAIGPGEQQDYINGVVLLSTRIEPASLLNLLQVIESDFGRERNIKWGARTLDLDILLYGNETVNTNILTIPHPQMHQRNFVLYPLYELNPELILPNGIAISTLLTSVSASGLTKLGGNADC